MRLQPGDAFDRYTIEALLGEGGMGEVYRAMDSKLHRRIALKVIRDAKTNDETWGRAVARMVREARAAAALNHPNAVAIFDVGEVGGAPFLAMELIEGTPLRHLIGGDAPLEARMRWLCDVARALSAAHHAGLVHRDIKPENVMLRSDGMIKVLDFGIARGVKVDLDTAGPTADGGIATLTGQGKFVGTPAYMAPEQIRGDAFDGRADQFSWGVVAYEILSGKVPFGAKREAMHIIAAVLSQEEAPLTDVPEAIADIIHRALSKSPDDRFASMDEIVEALSALGVGAGVELPPVSGALSGEGAGLRMITTPRSSIRGADIGAQSLPRTTGGGTKTEPSSRPRGASSASSLASVNSSGPVELPAEAQRRSKWPLYAIAAGAFCALSAAVLIAQRPPGAPRLVATSAPLSAPLSAAPIPTPITQTALPKTQSSEALAAYSEGLQGFRDASWITAYDALQRALKLDPTLAAAYLRIALISRLMTNTQESRDAFRRAAQLRASLSEREQALLDGLEPYLQREPADEAEAFRRLTAVSLRYPGDAEIVALMMIVEPSRSPALLVELAERCIALDPEYADCLQAKAGALAQLGRSEEARSVIAQCIASTPSGIDCLRDKAKLDRVSGHCKDFQADAREMLGRAPDSSESYRFLATALYALDRPRETVRKALEQAWLRDLAANKDEQRIVDEIRLATLAGRLGEVEKLALKLNEKVALNPTEVAHYGPTNLLIYVYQEMGREKEAGRIADAMLTGRDAWIRTPDASIWNDATMKLWNTERRAGMISREDYEAKRSAWLLDVKKTRSPQEDGAAWVMGYAVPASTAEEAKEALAAMPDLAPIAYQLTFPSASASVGKTYLLAGREREALPHLRRGTADCGAFEDPFRHTIASYHLGEALAATGDKEGACAALKVVLDRWGTGDAKGTKSSNRSTRSITAKAAATRSKALQCRSSAPLPSR